MRFLSNKPTLAVTTLPHRGQHANPALYFSCALRLPPLERRRILKSSATLRGFCVIFAVFAESKLRSPIVPAFYACHHLKDVRYWKMVDFDAGSVSTLLKSGAMPRGFCVYFAGRSCGARCRRLRHVGSNRAGSRSAPTLLPCYLSTLLPYHLTT